MKRGWHDLEVVIDRLIPYTLVLLLFVIIGEIFFHHEIEPYHFWIEIIDIFIILVFATDLYFKWTRVKNIKKFLRRYWLDIIAIFPFFLMFRLVEESAAIGAFLRETFSPGQKILHEGLEIQSGTAKVIEGVRAESRVITGLEKEGAKIAAEVEKFGKISRSEKLSKLIRPFSRVPRALKFASDGAHKKLEKEIRGIENVTEKDVKKIERKVRKAELKIEEELKRGSKFIKKEERKAGRFFNSFVFYEKPTGRHHVHERN